MINEGLLIGSLSETKQEMPGHIAKCKKKKRIEKQTQSTFSDPYYIFFF